MKKIAYIEIDTHAEIAQAFIDIMKDSKEFSVDYYFSKKIRDQVKEEGVHIFLSDSSMITDQLKAKRYDLIIIGTVHRYFNTFLSIVRNYHVAVIAHNLNFSLASKLKLAQSIFKEDIIYRLKLCLKEGLFYSSKVYEKANQLLVLDHDLVSEKYEFLPLFYTAEIETVENKDTVIVIPGGVSQRRRNYKHVYEVIQNMKTSEPYTFVFLGKADKKEQKALSVLSESIVENISIRYFKERVSADDYRKWMQKADVLWCPLQRETVFFSQKEVYGKTKMTGNIGDAIKYEKMAIFPKDYSSTLTFVIPEKENIIEQFQQIKNQKFDFQKLYNKKTIQKNLEEVLDGLIII